MALDEASAILDDITFSMAYLMGEDELIECLTYSDNGSELGQLLYATFRLKYGDARIPRRILSASGVFEALERLSESGSPLARALALRALCARASTPDSAAAALNELVEIAPDQDATRAVVANTLLSFLIEDIGRGTPISSLDDFAVESGLSGSVLQLLDGLPEATVLSTESSDICDAAIALLNESDSIHTRRWCAALLAAIDPEIAASLAQTPEVAVALCASDDFRRDPERAYDVLNSCGVLTSIRGPDVIHLNSLAMALVRTGATDGAIALFSRLEEELPSTQAALFAREHIDHLQSTAQSAKRSRS